MKINRIKLENFKIHKNLEINFDEKDIINNDEGLNKLKNDIYSKSKETIIKIKVRYKKDYYINIKNLLENLIESGYLILDDSYSLDEEIKLNNEVITIDNIMDSSFFVNNKQEIIKMLNYIKELFEEMYSGKNSDLDRIREALFKQLIK